MRKATEVPGSLRLRVLPRLSQGREPKLLLPAVSTVLTSNSGMRVAACLRCAHAQTPQRYSSGRAASIAKLPSGLIIASSGAWSDDARLPTDRELRNRRQHA